MSWQHGQGLHVSGSSRVQSPFLLAHEFIQHLVDKMCDRIDVFQVTNTTGQRMAAAVEEWCAHFCVDKSMVVPIWALW